MKVVKQAALMLSVMTLVTGVLYPLVVTAIAHAIAPTNARGDATLIGRSYTDPRYFWGRPSATPEQPYNAKASSGSNHGPLSEALATAVKERIAALHAAGDVGAPPVDLVTASASGLDPHISPDAAHYQAPRVAKLRGMSLAQVEQMIGAATEAPTFAILGAPRVHVLELNQSLDNGD
ncbi:MAG: potassium-transporting ATPase subunit KdpC [Myxococcota bacterium]